MSDEEHDFGYIRMYFADRHHAVDQMPNGRADFLSSLRQSELSQVVPQAGVLFDGMDVSLDLAVRDNSCRFDHRSLYRTDRAKYSVIARNCVVSVARRIPFEQIRGNVILLGIIGVTYPMSSVVLRHGQAASNPGAFVKERMRTKWIKSET